MTIHVRESQTFRFRESWDADINVDVMGNDNEKMQIMRKHILAGYQEIREYNQKR